MKKTLFLTNFDQRIGLGHLSRCSSIARELKFHGHKSFLLTRQSSFQEDRLLSAFDSLYYYDCKSFFQKLNHLNQKFSFSNIVIDDYAINHNQIVERLRKQVDIVRFNLNPEIEDKTSTIINYSPVYQNNNSKHLLGKDFIIIDEKFHHLKKKIKDEVLVFFGGGGDHSALKKFHEYLEFLSQKIARVNIAITSSYKNKNEIINRYSKKNKFNVLLDSKSFASTLNNSKFSFISGGTISYESAFLQTPMQIVSVAENQSKQSVSWHENGNAKYLGSIQSVDTNALKESYESFFSNNDLITSWYGKRKIFIDGLGVKRIVEILV